MEPNVNPVVQSMIPAKIDGPVAIFSSAWSLFKSNWRIILPIVALPGLSFGIAQIFFVTGSAILAVVGFLLMIAGVVLSIASQPAVIDTLHKISTTGGQVISLKGQYRFGFGLFWSVLLLAIMQGLIAFGSAVFFIIPAIIVGIFLSFSMYTLSLEGKRGFGALIESYNLVSGRWLGVFGRVLFMALVCIGIAIVITGATAIIQSLFGFAVNSVASSVLSIISSFVLSTCISSLSATYLYRLYISLKGVSIQSGSAGTFKKFLIAFMVIGIIAIVVFVAGGIALSLYVAGNVKDISSAFVK